MGTTVRPGLWGLRGASCPLTPFTPRGPAPPELSRLARLPSPRWSRERDRTVARPADSLSGKSQGFVPGPCVADPRVCLGPQCSVPHPASEAGPLGGLGPVSVGPGLLGDSRQGLTPAAQPSPAPAGTQQDSTLLERSQQPPLLGVRRQAVLANVGAVAPAPLAWVGPVSGEEALGPTLYLRTSGSPEPRHCALGTGHWALGTGWASPEPGRLTRSHLPQLRNPQCPVWRRDT